MYTATKLALQGMAAPFVGVRTLLANRQLWPVAGVPVALGLAWSVADIMGWALAPASGQWWWVIIDTLLRWALFAGVLLLQLWIALASPLLDWLSEQTEESLGSLPPGDVWWREVLRLTFWLRAGSALLEAIKLLLLKLALAIVGLSIGWLPLIGPPIAWLCAGIATGIDFLDYPLARRDATLKDKLAWGRRHWPAVLGFSSTIFAAALVPGLMGVLLVPTVVGGTQLVIGLGHLPESPPHLRSRRYAQGGNLYRINEAPHGQPPARDRPHPRG